MINNDNEYFQYALDNSNCFNIAHTKKELRIISRINSIFKKYKIAKSINIRLTINYFIILNNTFGKASVDLLNYKIDDAYRKSLCTFLEFIYLLPRDETMELDYNILKQLEEL